MLAQESSQWLDVLVGPGGLLVALLIVIYTGVKRYWVFGWAYEEKSKEADQWRQMALRGTSLAEKAVDAAPIDRRGGGGP